VVVATKAEPLTSTGAGLLPAVSFNWCNGASVKGDKVVTLWIPNAESNAICAATLWWGGKKLTVLWITRLGFNEPRPEKIPNRPVKTPINL
jgi:hypothetical protein